MEQKMTFDEQWEREEQQALMGRLRRERATWARRRRTGRTAALGVVATLAVATALELGGVAGDNVPATGEPAGSAHSRYVAVCSNRPSIPEGHWADVASGILTLPTL